MISRIFIFSVFILSSLVLEAQVEEKETLKPKEKIFFGGNFGLLFGTTTFIELSPVAGYQLTPRISSGLGFIYQYYRERTFFNTVFKTHIYGGRAFAQITAIKNLNDYIPLGLHAGIIGYAEYEMLNSENFTISDSSANNRYWRENLYIGGGLELPMSEKVKMNLLVLWNLNYSDEFQYSNPSVRIGFVIFPFRK